MATFTQPRLPIRQARSARPARATTPSVRRSVTSRAVTGYDSTDEPRRAASVVPVLLAFGALVLLSVAAAYFGREVISFVGSFLAAP